ncbi:MAG: class I SAM-dependent methyltransferase [Clostridia bacterium]|nr:class I SAM-dependent methyltransferase [Clostridia bacterium]
MNKTQKAFNFAGKSGMYDGVITGTGFFGSLVSNLVWKMDKEKDLEYQRLAKKGVPKDFDGSLLEVPVGTGILTMPMYKKLPNADVTCLDYSEGMMNRAKDRAQDMNIKNISFVQGDVGKLPFKDESFDFVLSMNGLHVFPDKDAAFSEIFRVLKKGGVFCGCTYIEGECKRTDWFINKIYVPKGYFNLPFDTKESLEKRLKGMYGEVEVETVISEACFKCVK